MNDSARPRLLILRVLVLSLLATLAGRLWFLQVVAADKYAAAAADNRIREVISPAARGMILDDMGRSLVRNRTAIVISVSYHDVSTQKDGGKAVIGRVARVVGMPAADVARRIRPCGPGVGQPCWNGSPLQPVPIAHYDVNDPAAAKKVLAIEEHREDYPGVSADLEAVRQYPYGSLAAHDLGYLSPITEEELAKPQYADYRKTDLIGRTGLESTYDAFLRGHDGIQQLTVNRNEKVTGVVSDTPPRSGGNLVLSIDERVQAIAESALAHWTAEARTRYDRSGRHFKADAAAAIVMEAQTGRIVALAGYPSYDPSLFVGGISFKEYARLNSAAAGYPLIDQATQGLYAPGSTFKISTTSAVVSEGRASLGGAYACPSSFTFGTGKYSNFEGESGGSIDLRRALIISCDTIFYKFAADDWLADGGLTPIAHPKESIAAMARAYGFGSRTGVDLPTDSEGRIADRAYKQALYKQLKPIYCRRAKTGYPEVADKARAAYLKALAVENCADGYLFRGGDAVIQAVGQGDTVVTPLQLAVAYAALANGGTVYEPRLAKAVLAANGKVIKTFAPTVKGHLPVAQNVLAYIRSALTQVPVQGTGAYAFAGFPLNKVPVAGKTGTAEVYGKQDTSWFSSFAPANDPKYVVTVMISQAGQGGLGAARAVREIYDGIYGFGKAKTAALPGGLTPTTLPHLLPDGTVRPPASAKPASPTATAQALPVAGLLMLGAAVRRRRRTGSARTAGRRP